MRLFMSVDLEGFAGISFWSEIDKRDPSSRENMEDITGRLVFLCERLKEKYADLDTVTICDSHARGNNIIYGRLPAYAELVRGFPRRYYMMHGLDPGYSGVIFAGYHVSAGNAGNMDHTYSSSVIHELRLNGVPASELAINSYFAGEYGVPVIMALGGDLFTAETARFSDAITLCAVKEEYGRYAGKSYSPAKVDRLISESVESMRRPEDYPVHRLAGPVEMDLEFGNTAAAEIASLVPGSQRISGRKVKYVCADMKELYELLMLVVTAAGRAADIR